VKGETPVSDSGGATGGAIVDATEAFDPDLASLIKAWPGLSRKARAAIAQIIEGEGDDSC